MPLSKVRSQWAEPERRQPETSLAGEFDLLSLLAHQLMTPLVLIDNSAQKMIRRAGEMDAAEIETRAARIRTATSRLSTLVRSLMERARFDQGQGAVLRQECSLETIVALACEPVRQSQPERAITLQVEGGRFMGDPLLLEQLVAILACNAAKYSPVETPIEITAAIRPDGVTIAVSDHGIGIPAADMGRLFQPYFRSENAAGYNGAGLGLHLASRIAHLHGGTIDAESREGQGSTFTVTLPVRA
jgi:signal transduction histidine kinase